MAAPDPRGANRREGLRRARWLAAGTAVGAAVVATGTIAVANAAPSHGSSAGNGSSVANQGGVTDDERGDAQPFTPQQQQTQQQYTPQFQPQTRSRGS
jgi:hypothetical protein